MQPSSRADDSKRRRMNSHSTIMIIAAVCAAMSAIVVAQNARTTPPSLRRSVQGDRPVVYEYVGTKRCRMCHTNQYDDWRSTSKADAFEALKPGRHPEIKRNAGLNVNLDYTTDERCLVCHTVGYNQPGGYAIPNPKDDRTQRVATAREGVGCEACHGPGSGFIQVMQDISRNDRPYHPSEVYQAGRKKVTLKKCLTCHNKNALCMTHNHDMTTLISRSGLKLNVTERKGFHKKFPFKYRVPQEKIPPFTKKTRGE